MVIRTTKITSVFLCGLMLLNVSLSSGASVSIAVDSNCGSDPPQGSVIIIHYSVVNLTCCVEGYLCPQRVSWYRGNENGVNRSAVISHDTFLSVNLNTTQETFVCVTVSISLDPVCDVDVPGETSVTLRKGNCDNSGSLMNVNSHSNHSYALVGHSKTLPFIFKYAGAKIKLFVLVNTTHLHDVTYIHHKSQHHVANLQTCTEEYDIILEDVAFNYSGRYTAFASTTGSFDRTDPHYTVLLQICEKPLLIYNHSSTSEDTSILQCKFKACYDSGGGHRLINFYWTKDSQPLNRSDKHYEHNYKPINDSVYSYKLIIHNTTVDDTGYYTCILHYKEALINQSVETTGFILLNITNSASSKSSENTLILSTILGGGSIVLLIIFVVLALLYKRANCCPPQCNPVVLGEATRLLTPEQEIRLPNVIGDQRVLPQQPVSTTDLDESFMQPSMPPLVLTIPVDQHHQPRVTSPPLLKPFSKVMQRLNYYRKDIAELLAGRSKDEVIAYFKEKNILHKNQHRHFILLDDTVQSYNYLIDAVLASGQADAEKFFRYLLDTDVTDYFFNLVAPKVFLLYTMITGTLEENLTQFADLLRQCGINVICDFYEDGTEARPMFNLWVEQKVNECIDSGGFVLVDVSNGPMNDLSHTQDEDTFLKMKNGQFDNKLVYQMVTANRKSFIPFCLDVPRPAKAFPFLISSVYVVYFTEFQKSLLDFKETKYVHQFNVRDNDPEVIRVFLNEAPEKFQPIVDLISLLTSQQRL